MLKKITLLLTLSLSLYASTIEVIKNASITQLSSYAFDKDEGITFTSNQQGTICDGYWLSTKNPGYTSILRMIMTAYQAQNEDLTITANSAATLKWSGSKSKHYCQISSLYFDQGVSAPVEPLPTNIIGTDGEDTLFGDNKENTLIGDRGNDTYLFNKGDGIDTIKETYGLNENRLILGSGITKENLTIKSSGHSLVIGLNEDEKPWDQLKDKVIIQNWAYYYDNHLSIEHILLENGDVLKKDDLLSMQTTPFDDTIVGTSYDDTLVGGKGNDLLKGGRGNDTYYYNDGDGIDTIEESFGTTEDKLIFGPGILKENLIVKSSGSSLIIGLKKPQVLWENLKNKVILTNWDESHTINYIILSNNEVLNIQDILSMQETPNSDNIIGTDNNDFIKGGEGNDNLDGKWGDDTYYYNRGDGIDTINDKYGINDTLAFGDNIDQSDLIVKISDQTLTIALKKDGVLWDNLTDKIIVSKWDNYNYNIGDYHNAYPSFDYSIDYITFTNGQVLRKSDILAMQATENNDHIFGTDNHDTLSGGAGNDLLKGGKGEDTYLFNKNDGIDTIEETTASGNDTILFGEGINKSNLIIKAVDINHTLVIALKEPDVLWENLNDKVIIKMWNYSSVDGIRIEQIMLSNGTVLDNQDFIDMQATLLDDTVIGTDRNDVLNGKSGNDTLKGGHGDDTYYFNRGDGIDTIIEEHWNEDTLIFGPGILKEHLIVKQSDSALTIGLKESGVAWANLKDKVIFKYWHNDYVDQRSVDYIVLSDREVLTKGQLQSMITP
jgi:Ca2+-binding RTX toxin-like protein